MEQHHNVQTTTGRFLLLVYLFNCFLLSHEHVAEEPVVPPDGQNIPDLETCNNSATKCCGTLLSDFCCDATCP